MLHACKICAAILTPFLSFLPSILFLNRRYYRRVCENRLHAFYSSKCVLNVSKQCVKLRNCHRCFVMSFISFVQYKIRCCRKFMLLLLNKWFCVSYVSERFLHNGSFVFFCVLLLAVYMMSVKPSPSCLVFYLLPIVTVVVVVITISLLSSLEWLMLLLWLLCYICRSVCHLPSTFFSRPTIKPSSYVRLLAYFVYVQYECASFAHCKFSGLFFVFIFHYFYHHT